MIARCIIHVEGPAGSGKTTFIEALLESTNEWVLAARGTRDDALDELEEAVAPDHPELERYGKAGAAGAARIRFPATDDPFDDLFLSDLMFEPSDAVVIEGDCPLSWPDLRVFVAPAPPIGSRLFVRRKRDRHRAEREKARMLEQARASSPSRTRTRSRSRAFPPTTGTGAGFG